jgi:RNase adaptor protein for sRNA GlmZ degradation
MFFIPKKHQLVMSELETLELIQKLTESLANKNRHDQRITFCSFGIIVQSEGSQAHTDSFSFFID